VDFIKLSRVNVIFLLWTQINLNLYIPHLPSDIGVIRHKEFSHNVSNFNFRPNWYRSGHTFHMGANKITLLFVP
jgi:hypothetical protein